MRACVQARVREKVEEFFKRKKLIEKYREWNTHTHAQLTGRVEEELKWKTSRRGQARNEIQEEKCWLSWINGWMDLHSSAGANADGTRRELFPRIQLFPYDRNENYSWLMMSLRGSRILTVLPTPRTIDVTSLSTVAELPTGF